MLLPSHLPAFVNTVPLGNLELVLLLEEIRRSPVEVGSLSHYLQGSIYCTSQVVNRISEPSTVWISTPLNMILLENGCLEYDRFLLEWPIFRGMASLVGLRRVTSILDFLGYLFRYHLDGPATRNPTCYPPWICFIFAPESHDCYKIFAWKTLQEGQSGARWKKTAGV